MDIKLFLLTLRARWLLFALAFVLTVAAATAATLALPKSYKATASLLVDAKEEQSLDSALRPMLMPQEMVNYLQTQTDILTSEKVARKVVEDLNLASDPATVEDFEKAGGARRGATLEDWLVESLHQGLEVETSQSSVIQVSFTSGNPRSAAAIANAFANAFIRTTLELRVEPTREAAAWFDEQLKSLRQNLEDAQAKLTEYHRSAGIVSADEQYDVESTRLALLADQVARAQEQSSGWRSREQQARESLVLLGSTERLPEVLENPFIQRLKEELMRGEARLSQLSTQYGVNHPQYQRQVLENEGMRTKLRSEMEKVVSSMGNAAELSKQRAEDLRRALAAQRARVLDLKGDRNELTVLRRNADSAERAYDTAMQRFVASQVDSRANQANVSILNEASPPRRAHRPRTRLNIAVSLVVGMLLGVAAVLLAEMFDRRVRSRRDLDLDVPMLAVLNVWQLPSSGSGRRRKLRRMQALGA
jgi:polysaccharide biosynthesis transport protein